MAVATVRAAVDEAGRRLGLPLIAGGKSFGTLPMLFLQGTRDELAEAISSWAAAL